MKEIHCSGARVSMDIHTANVYRLQVPMKGSYRASVHDFSVMDSVLVVLNTPDGERGISTIDPSPGYSRQTPDKIEEDLRDRLLPKIIDATPESPNKLIELLNSIKGIENAKYGVEMAFLDLYCRQRGQTIAELCGGSLRYKEPLNAWVGIDAPEAMAERAEEWRGRGYSSVKLKLNGDPRADAARIEAVCDAVNPDGDGMKIRADANGAYSVADAIELTRSVNNLPLAHIEQPVPFDDLQGLARVKESTTIPIMADECLLSLQQLSTVISLNAADRVKLKPMRLGSILAAKKGIEIAAASGRSSVIGHGFGLSPATSAEVQLASTMSEVYRPIESVGPVKMKEEPFSPTLTDEGGSVSVPSKNGLGVRIDDSRLADFVSNDISIN